MTTRILRRLALLTLLPTALVSKADTLGNANALFEFAESSYPELLSPAAPETQQLQGFYVRHYTDTNIFLGVQGDNIWAYGPQQLGPDVVYVGKLEELLTLPQTDITDVLLSRRNPECSYYADDLISSVRDVKRSQSFSGNLDISVDPQTSECVFSSNGIPNHDFNDSGAAFATNVSAVQSEFRIPLEPSFANQTTAISLEYDNAIMLNGVKLDLLAAACYNVGDEKIGCNDINQPWRLDPMSGNNQFGTDAHNAHTQPDGAYHYHGNPLALFSQQADGESPVIGFAADGFPIYGSFINDNGQIRAVQSSYQLIDGNRPSSADDPGGPYDGTYVDDYEYVKDSGDLDECNGMMRAGSYGYYVTDAYPWVLACFRGTPNISFQKSGDDQGGGHPGGGMMPPPP